VYGRLAFGGQCVAAMAMIAGPVLFITACIVPFAVWGDDRGGAAVLARRLGAGDRGGAAASRSARSPGAGRATGSLNGRYAVGFGIAGVATAVLAYMLTSTPVPVYASFAAMMAAAFVAGCLVAGHLGGMRVLPEQREQRQRAAARRR
jgi:hypothetical protein